MVLRFWKQDQVAFTLVIPFRMVVIYVVLQAVTEGTFTEEDHFRQELGFNRSDPAFAMSVQVWTAWWQFDGLDADSFEDSIKR